MSGKNENIYPDLPGATAPDANDGNQGQGVQQQPQPQSQQVFVLPAPGHGVPLGPNPTMVTCPSCHQTQMSQIRYESSTKTHLFATILCLTTCCCCIPYMIDSCKNANHVCTNCGAYLGTYNN